jgi:hypothetical protein
MTEREQEPLGVWAEVWVDGEPWQPVADLDRAGPDDCVFALDHRSGAVRFGDGVHGRRPRAGSSVRATYRYGNGREHSVTHPWPLAAAAFIAELAEKGEIVGRVGSVAPAECVSLKRVHYFEGQLLGVSDLQAEQDYGRQTRRRHRRRLHGTGVVDGLVVSVEGETVHIAPGLAIDPQGEEVEIPESWIGRIPAGDAGWYVGLSFAECATDPVAVPDSLEPRASRVQEGFRIGFDSALDPRAVALGRLVRGRDGWAVDPEFQPPRVI